jgi:6-pyruvoyltetrahydropterin/6-carboxytetrahydropterin synthase
MYQVGIRNRFQARHFLRGDFAEESTPHGHDYELEWICRTEGLDENGFSVDIALLEELLETEARGVRDVLLNDLEFFRDRQPSVENMARFFHQRLLAALRGRGYAVDRIVRAELRIWESPQAWASYGAAP